MLVLLLWMVAPAAEAMPRSTSLYPGASSLEAGTVELSAGLVGGAHFLADPGAFGGAGIWGGGTVTPRLTLSFAATGGTVYAPLAYSLGEGVLPSEIGGFTALAGSLRYDLVSNDRLRLGVVGTAMAGGFGWWNDTTLGGVVGASFVGEVGAQTRLDFAAPVFFIGVSEVGLTIPDYPSYLAFLALSEIAVSTPLGPGRIRAGKGLEGVMVSYTAPLGAQAWVAASVGSYLLTTGSTLRVGSTW